MARQPHHRSSATRGEAAALIFRINTQWHHLQLQGQNQHLYELIHEQSTYLSPPCSADSIPTPVDRYVFTCYPHVAAALEPAADGDQPHPDRILFQLLRVSPRLWPAVRPLRTSPSAVRWDCPVYPCFSAVCPG